MLARAVAPEDLVSGRTRLTGNFGEARGLRFHAGVDLSIGGVQGRALTSPVDGDVRRIAASYYGYGKQLLIEDSQGRRHLFAHLLDLREDLEQELLRRQLGAGRYHQSWDPGPGRFTVRAGEVIARGGDSGSGPPHLHYELRSADNRPLNPLLFGLEVKDDRPPRILEVALLPAETDSRIEGSLLPWVAAPHHLPDTLRATGSIDLALRAQDKVNGSESRLLPARYLLLEDEDTLSLVALDHFSFAENRQASRVIHLPLSNVLERDFVSLAWPNGERPFDRRHHRPVPDEPDAQPGSGGRLTAPEQTVLRILTLVVEDAAGNRAEQPLLLLHGPLDLDPEPARGRSGSDWPSRRDWWLEDGVHLALPAGVDRVRVESGAGLHWLPVGRRTRGSHQVAVAGHLLPDGPASLAWFKEERLLGSRSLDGFWLEAGRALRARVDESLRIVVPADASGRPQRLLLAREQTAEGELLRLGPEGLSLEQAVDLVPVTAATRPAGSHWLRRSTDDDQAVWFDKLEDDGALSTRRPGLYHMAQDTAGPVIRARKPGARSRQPRPVFVFDVEDVSGVSHVELRLNGDLALPRYDPDSQRVLFRPAVDLAPGSWRVELVVVDRLENTSTLESSLIIAP